MFKVFILIAYMGHPALIWMSNASYETKEDCAPHVEEQMTRLRDSNANKGFEPLSGTCDTEENMRIKMEPRNDRTS